MDDHDVGAAGRRDPRGVVEHPDGHPVLLVALDVPREGRQRGVDRERDAGLAGQLAKPLRERPVHPEAASELDLARVIAALGEQLERGLRAVVRRHARRAEADGAHPRSVARGFRARRC